MIFKTWSCDTEGCENEFTTGDSEPACPNCGGDKLTWVPSAGHGGILSGGTKFQDSYWRGQSEAYGMSDFRTARAGENVIKSRPTRQGPMWGPSGAPGWQMPLAMDAGGNPVASCQPCGVTSPINAKPSNAPLPGRPASGPLPGTQIIGRYAGK